jgi:hypothetical protein
VKIPSKKKGAMMSKSVPQHARVLDGHRLISSTVISKYFKTTERPPVDARPNTASLWPADYRPNFLLNQNRRTSTTMGIIVPDFLESIFYSARATDSTREAGGRYGHPLELTGSAVTEVTRHRHMQPCKWLAPL